jgi:oligopeptide/dipeptide ABC transporter ATP-binding protein
MPSAVRTRWRNVVRTPVGAAATALLVLVLVMAIIAPLLWGDKATADDTAHTLAGPSGAHWLGTDNLGRDIFYRMLVATRLSIELALLSTAITLVLGILLGTAPAILGRTVGRLSTAIVNIAIAFPGLLLALFFSVIFGVGMKGAVLAIGLAGAPVFARVVQNLVAGVAGRDFVSAARIAGVGRIRLMTRHLLPNIAEPLVVNATLGAGGALLAFAGLSFLGLGVQAPDYDWGRLLGEGLSGIYVHPAAALAPGVAIVIAGLAFNLFGEAVAKGVGLQPTLAPGQGSLPPHPLAGRPREAQAGRSTESSEPANESVLSVQRLRVAFPSTAGWVTPVRDVSFSLRRGEALGIVGESGSGKSLTAHAIASLIEEPGSVQADRLDFQGSSLLGPQTRARRHLLGTSLAMVFQDPMTSFNPTQRIGRQLAEVTQAHQQLGKRAGMARAVDRLRAVRVPAAERRARQYPHEFSGGMRQRAMIGMGLMGDPALIIADEPTTALDVTVQQQVLRLLDRIRSTDNLALVLISHDISVVRRVCGRVLVMYAGRIVEDVPADDMLRHARHPYTRALLAAAPGMGTDRDQPLAVIPGRPVAPGGLPDGCAFAPRCGYADAQCRREDPPLVSIGGGRRVACWHTDQVAAEAHTAVRAESEPDDHPASVEAGTVGTGND